GDLIANANHLELVPLIRGHLSIRSAELNPAPPDHVVESKVVFERIGSQYIVVAGISIPKDQASRLVNSTGYGFEFYAEFQVLKRALVGHNNRESVIRRII